MIAYHALYCLAWNFLYVIENVILSWHLSWAQACKEIH